MHPRKIEITPQIAFYVAREFRSLDSSIRTLSFSSIRMIHTHISLREGEIAGVMAYRSSHWNRINEDAGLASKKSRRDSVAMQISPLSR